MGLYISDGCNEDLDALWRDAPNDAATLTDLLAEVDEDPALCDRLCAQGFSNDKFNVLRFEELWRRGLNMYRLRPWDVANYRVVYAHDPTDDSYTALAILPRDLDYDPDDHRIQRALAEYQALGFPAFGDH